MEKEQMLKLLEGEVLSKIYGFCRIKMNTSEDAEDLAQDICLELLKVIEKGKRIENFGAFVFSVCNNVFYNTLRRKKNKTTLYLDEMMPSDDSIDEDLIMKEEIGALRRELALMSGNYRKSVIMYYYHGMSCNEIGAALGKSSGTVKWWLHDARKKIEKGMNTMREFGEKSYCPGTLFLSCQGMPGNNGEPMSCVTRKVAQNILLAAYRAPLTVDEMCDELGIPAPYIEDEVENLLKNELIKEISKERYQTDFVILPGDNFGIADKIYSMAFPKYYEELFDFLESKKELLTSGAFNTADFTWERLLWVYIHVMTVLAIGIYKAENKIGVEYADMPYRPMGGRWIALGFEKDGIGLKTPFKKYHAYDGPVQKTDNACVQGFFHLWSDDGADSGRFFDIPEDVFALCRDIINGGVVPESFDEMQKYYFSIALENRLFIKKGNNFIQNYYYINKDGRKCIEALASEFYPRVSNVIKDAYEMIFKECRTHIPKCLCWQMGNFLSNHLNYLVTCSLYEAQKRGHLSRPSELNRYWLSLFASE